MGLSSSSSGGSPFGSSGGIGSPPQGGMQPRQMRDGPLATALHGPDGAQYRNPMAMFSMMLQHGNDPNWNHIAPGQTPPGQPPNQTPAQPQMMPPSNNGNFTGQSVNNGPSNGYQGTNYTPMPDPQHGSQSFGSFGNGNNTSIDAPMMPNANFGGMQSNLGGMPQNGQQQNNYGQQFHNAINRYSPRGYR